MFPRSVGKLSIHFPSNRGIATPVYALARNDSVYSTNPNLSLLCNRIPELTAEIGYTNNTFQAKEDNTMSVITITKDNFQQEVLSSDKPVLLDFWASWCGPCRMVSPIVDEIAEERSDIKVGKINVDEQSELAARFRVMSIPTLVVMKNGEIVTQSVGARPKAQILAML